MDGGGIAWGLAITLMTCTWKVETTGKEIMGKDKAKKSITDV